MWRTMASVVTCWKRTCPAEIEEVKPFLEVEVGTLQEEVGQKVASS